MLKSIYVISIALLATSLIACGDDGESTDFSEPESTASNTSASNTSTSNTSTSNTSTSNTSTSNTSTSNTSTSNTSTSNTSTGDFTVEDYALAFSEALCNKLFECCPDGNEFLMSADQCTGFLAGFIGDSTNQGVNEGKMTFNAAKAEECANAFQGIVEAVSCETFDLTDIDLTTLTACEEAVVGNVGEGESCLLSDGSSNEGVCQGELECIGEVCTTTPVLGNDCADSFDACGDELFCAEDDTCAEPLAEGATCDPINFGQDCESGECEDGTCGPVSTDICGG